MTFGRRVAALALALGLPQPGAIQERPAIEDAIVREPTRAASPQVTTAELRTLLAGGSAMVLDARPREEFAMSHIPGAINVRQKPGSSISTYVPDVADVSRVVPDRTRLLVVYCNGPFCGKSRRFAEELMTAGYRNVRRYQLGMPGWRTAGGVAAIEADAIRRIAALDGTAVFVTTELPSSVPPLPRVVTLRSDEVTRAKDDGRLPMTDHNTRLIVIGRNGAEARSLAEAIAANAFHNVAYYDGNGATIDTRVAK